MSLGLSYPSCIPRLEFTTLSMATVQDETAGPAIRFKRRKVAHSKRVHISKDPPPVSNTQSADVLSRTDAPLPSEQLEDDNSAPNLRDIIRGRKRPRDRFKDAMRNVEAPRTELVVVDTPQKGHYTSRFVAQTGQVVDRDDKQM
jgi:hypothetical protein